MNFASVDRRRRFSLERPSSPRRASAGSRPPSSRGSRSGSVSQRRYRSQRQGSMEPPLRQPSPAVLECLPVIPDTSIRGTTSNPKVRHWKASFLRSSVSLQRSDEGGGGGGGGLVQSEEDALKKLSVILAPILQLSVLRRRRIQSWPGTYPPRSHTFDSVVSAIMSSSSIFSRWPEDLLYNMAAEAVYEFKKNAERIVYYNESYISSGLIIVLYGEVQEHRRDGKSNAKISGDGFPHSNRVRTHHAPAVLCEVSVLSEDRSLTSFVTKGMVDIGIIPSRWFWEVLYRYLAVGQGSSMMGMMTVSAINSLGNFHAFRTGGDGELSVIKECIQQIVLPYRTDTLLTTYFPTTVVLQRSWISLFLSVSDRVKLSRTMEVKAFSVGDLVCEEGKYSPYIYVVRRGTLTVKIKGVQLGMLGSGSAFGEVSVLMGDPRNSTIEASSIVELYCLHAEELLRRFSKYPELGNTLIGKAVEYRHRWMEEGKKPREIFGLAVLLVGVPCLSHVPEAMRNRIAAESQVLSFPADAVIAYKGDSCDALYVIGRGVVRLSSIGPEREKSKKKKGKKEKHKKTSLNQRPPSAPVLENEDIRSSGDHFGEYCLIPHQWWQAAIAITTVDLWRIPRHVLTDSLTTEAGLAQAEEVCRQGIALYQARHGVPNPVSESSSSLIPSPSDAGGSSAQKDKPVRPPIGAKKKRQGSVGGAGSSSKNVLSPRSTKTDRRNSKTSVQPVSPIAKGKGERKSEVGRKRSSVRPISADRLKEQEEQQQEFEEGGSGVAEPVEPEEETNWPEYAMDQTACMLDKLEEEEAARRQAEEAARRQAEESAPDHSSIKKHSSKPLPLRRMRELQRADKVNEEELTGKVRHLISATFEIPYPADCDIMPDMGELNAVVVEQLFLTPTEEQGRFMKQVNKSNIKLVGQDEGEPGGNASFGAVEVIPSGDQIGFQVGDKLIDETVQALVEVYPVQAAAPLEEIIEQEKVENKKIMEFQPLSLSPDEIFFADSNNFFSNAVPQLRSSSLENQVRVGSPTEEGSFHMSQTLRSSTTKSYFHHSLSVLGGVGRSSIGAFSRPGSASPRLLRDSSISAVNRPWSTTWTGGSTAVTDALSLPPSLGSPSAPPRPVSVDIRRQSIAKMGSTKDSGKSATVLEHFVRVQDQEYLKSLVKVLPFEPQEELFVDDVDDEGTASALDEGGGRSSIRNGSGPRSFRGSEGDNMLVLLHVKECRYLDETLLQACKQPMVKVRIRASTRLETPPIQDFNAPNWSPKEASIITFVNRQQCFDFEICDGKAEKGTKPIYRCRLALSECPRNNGIVQQSMRLFPGDCPLDAAPATEPGASVPRLTVTLLTITHSEYKSVQERLVTMRKKKKSAARRKSKWKTFTHLTSGTRSTTLAGGAEKSHSDEDYDDEEEEEGDGKGGEADENGGKRKGGKNGGKLVARSGNDGGAGVANLGGCPVELDGNMVVFQVFGVQHLKHRVEGSMTVTLENDGAATTVLETPRAPGKSRNPSWPAVVAFCKVQSDGFLRFDFYHKSTIISTLKVAVDTLAFGGLGYRDFPLLLASSKNEIIGELQLNVLQTKIDTEKVGGDKAKEDRVMFLHIERCMIESHAKVDPPRGNGSQSTTAMSGEDSRMTSSGTSRTAARSSKVVDKADSWIGIHPGAADTVAAGGEEEETFSVAIEPDILVVVRNEEGALVLQTPLVLSTLDASWSRYVASCFIPCPALKGTSSTYCMEVYDSMIGKANMLGKGNVLVSREGLGVENRYDVRFNGPRYGGRIRVTCLCLPVIDVYGTMKALASVEETAAVGASTSGGIGAGGAGVSGTGGLNVNHGGSNGYKAESSPNSLPARLPLNPPHRPADDVLLLIHIAGCEKLFQLVNSSVEVDAIVTAAFRGEKGGVGFKKKKRKTKQSGRIEKYPGDEDEDEEEEEGKEEMEEDEEEGAGGGAGGSMVLGGAGGAQGLLRTPICPQTNNPKWKLSDGASTVLLRVRQDEEHTKIRWNVYDGTINTVDRLSTAVTVLRDMCLTGLHHLPLQEPSSRYRQQAGSSKSFQDPRFLGTLRVETFCGKIGAPVFPRSRLPRLKVLGDKEASFRSRSVEFSMMGKGFFGTPMSDAMSPSFSVASPLLLGQKADHEGGRQGVLGSASPFIRCAITNVCQILPQAYSKSIDICVRDGKRVIISCTKTGVQSENDTWHWDEGMSCIDLSHFGLMDKEIKVDVIAKDIKMGPEGKSIGPYDLEKGDEKNPASAASSTMGNENPDEQAATTISTKYPMNATTAPALNEKKDGKIQIGSGAIPVDTLRLIKPDEVVLYTVFLKSTLPDSLRKSGRPPMAASHGGAKKTKMMEDLQGPSISFSLIGLLHAI